MVLGLGLEFLVVWGLGLGSVVISWVCGRFLDRGLLLCPALVCGHLLGLWSFPGSRSVVMSWVSLWSSSGPVVHFLDHGLWSCHRSVCGHLLGLWSFLGSWAVVISLGGAVLILWVCGHFRDRGLWSCPGCLGSVVISWIVVCGHVLGLWSSPGLAVIS